MRHLRPTRRPFLTIVAGFAVFSGSSPPKAGVVLATFLIPSSETADGDETRGEGTGECTTVAPALGPFSKDEGPYGTTEDDVFLANLFWGWEGESFGCK